MWVEHRRSTASSCCCSRRSARAVGGCGWWAGTLLGPEPPRLLVGCGGWRPCRLPLWGWLGGGRGVVVRCRVDASIEPASDPGDVPGVLRDVRWGWVGLVRCFGMRPAVLDRSDGSGWLLAGWGCSGGWVWWVCRLCCVWLVVWSSCQGRTVDALAPGADEGRGSLRYAPGSWQPSCDPGVSEWGNPAAVMGRHHHLNA